MENHSLLQLCTTLNHCQIHAAKKLKEQDAMFSSNAPMAESKPHRGAECETVGLLDGFGSRFETLKVQSLDVTSLLCRLCAGFVLICIVCISLCTSIIVKDAAKLILHRFFLSLEQCSDTLCPTHPWRSADPSNHSGNHRSLPQRPVQHCAESSALLPSAHGWMESPTASWVRHCALSTTPFAVADCGTGSKKEQIQSSQSIAFLKSI